MMNDTLFSSWIEVLELSSKSLWLSFVDFTPKLVVAIVLFIVGWVVGSLLLKAIERLFGILKIDAIFRSLGTDKILQKANVNLNVGYFVGQIARWFVIIVALLASLDLVGLREITSFLRGDVLEFLSNVFGAVFILIIAAVLSEVVTKTVVASVKSLSLSSYANMIGVFVKYSIWVFAFLIAMEKVGINVYLIEMLLTGIVGMVAVAGALAFGLGGKEAAARLITKIGEEISRR